MERRLSKAAVQGWLTWLREQEKSRNTIDKYRRDILHLYAYLDGEKSLDRGNVLDYKEELMRTYAAASVNSMLAAVNSFFAYNGWSDLKLKHIKTQRRVFCAAEKELTKPEYIRLLRTAKAEGNERLYLLILTLCSTGIRVGELAYITVSGLKKGQVQVNCKNKSRIVLLPGQLRTYLRSYAKKQGIRQGAIFVSENGNPLNRTNIWKEMKRLSSRAGVNPDKVFPHNLRHLFARTFYEQRKDIVKLGDILGHSSIETTRLYTISTGREHERQLGALGLVL